MKNIILSFLGSFCPSVLFNVERKNLFWAGLSGTIGWMVFITVKGITGSLVVSTFFGAMAVSLYSEIMARVLKTPAFIFSITGIFPLVPGIWAYNSLYLLAQGKYRESFNIGLATLGMACSIAFGLMLISAAFQSYSNIKSIKSKKKQH